MSNLYSTEQKLNLAKAIVNKFCGNNHTINANHMVKRLKRLEQKYLRRISSYHNVSDFCIPFSAIPPKHFNLMLLIGWLDQISHKPLPHLNGFYKLSSYIKPGITQDEHFITVNAYVQLLFTELELVDIYKPA